MIRKPSLRRFLIVLLILVGPLTQFQTLYACELVDGGKPKMVCCCDAASAMGATMDCKTDATCQDQLGMVDDGSSASSSCCDISYQPSQVAEASHPGSHAQVVMFDELQLPPMLVVGHIHEFVPTSYAVGVRRSAFSPPDKPVYLLTNRFRI